jgi:hypothetical protein
VIVIVNFVMVHFCDAGCCHVTFSHTLKQAWTLQQQLPRETLRDHCVLLALATEILPSSQSCLQRVVAKRGKLKWRMNKMAVVPRKSDPAGTSIF